MYTQACPGQDSSIADNIGGRGEVCQFLCAVHRGILGVEVWTWVRSELLAFGGYASQKDPRPPLPGLYDKVHLKKEAEEGTLFVILTKPVFQ
jgi:hypothetical protein